jgi:hypothetical protein
MGKKRKTKRKKEEKKRKNAMPVSITLTHHIA